MFGDLARDMKHGARLLRRSPSFSIIAILTLSISIGAAIATFSIVDAWLLQPLSFPEANRLVIALAATRERPTEPAIFIPFRNYVTWQEHSRSFVSLTAVFGRSYLIHNGDVAANSGVPATRGLRGGVATARGMVVTDSFFPTLGVSPLRGRTFEPRDQGTARAVLSHGLWQRHFGGSESVVGSTVRLNGVRHEIVGVMPSSFDVRMLDQPAGAELWTLLSPSEPGYGPAGAAPVAVLGRLQDGISITRSQREINDLFVRTESEFAESASRYVVLLTSLQEDNTRTVRATLMTVSGAVACLVLIAAFNIGTLLLGRGLARSREVAIRAAIGCGRVRLVRQFLSESLLLSLLGAIAGSAVGAACIRWFVSMSPLGTLPPTGVSLDSRAIAFAGVVTAAVALLCGVVPALRVAAVRPNEALLSAGDLRTTTRGGQSQSILLSIQIGATVLLLIMSSLLVRTFSRLSDVPLGFDSRNLFVMTLLLPVEMDTSARRNDFFDRLTQELGSIGGVEAVAAATSPPLTAGTIASITTEQSVDVQRLYVQEVTPTFFKTLRVATRAGRTFLETDAPESPRVAVVNESAARLLFGRLEGSVGERLRVSTEEWRHVVGVVANTRSTFFNTLEWQTRPIVFLPSLQAFATIRNPSLRTFEMHVYLRAERVVSRIDIASAIEAFERDVALVEFQAVSDAIGGAMRQPALRMYLLTSFAAVTLLLAAIGVYGLVSESVARRRREIAVRMSLGAEWQGVVQLAAKQAMLSAVVGCGVGCVLALLLGRVYATVVYGAAPNDLGAYAVATGMLLFVVLVAAAIPSARASRLDPITVLRAD